MYIIICSLFVRIKFYMRRRRRRRRAKNGRASLLLSLVSQSATEYFTRCLMVFDTGKWNDVGTKCALRDTRFPRNQDTVLRAPTSIYTYIRGMIVNGADATATEQWWWKQIQIRGKEHQPSTIKRSSGKSNKKKRSRNGEDGNVPTLCCALCYVPMCWWRLFT